MPEAVELLYIRHGLICVIEQFSIYVLNVAHVRPRPNCLKIVENGQKSIISFHFVCSFNSLILKLCTLLIINIMVCIQKIKLKGIKNGRCDHLKFTHIQNANLKNYRLLNKCF